MAVNKLITLLWVVGVVSAQNFKVCILSSSPTLCRNLERDGSQAVCLSVESNRANALPPGCGLFARLLRQAAQPQEIGFFFRSCTDKICVCMYMVMMKAAVSFLTQPYAYESVAIVPNNHTGGLDGLRGGRYCHPGMDEQDLRWSPRVLKTLELNAARTDRCPESPTAHKTAEELEVETLSNFFSAACRPGPWSANATVDADLKSRFTSLCSLCGTNSTCSGYTLDMGVAIAGVRNDNRHIQALECLRVNSNASEPAVAYVAWAHVREFFTTRNPQDAASYSVLCPNGTLVGLTLEQLNNATSPCSIVSQPWGAIVTSTTQAAAVWNGLRTWWPNGSDPGGNTWQSVLFGALAGGATAKVVFQDTPITLINYTAPIRSIPNIDSTASCLPARRWCTLSTLEQTKCSWARNAAYSLGLEPTISCQQRTSVLECLSDIQADRADFISSPSNYGFLARQQYKLTPVKLVQNTRSEASRVAAFVKDSAAQNNNITRFENLRGTKACFPEFGGLAYVAFVRAAHERGVINKAQCDYGTAVAEFFDGACAPGAMDANHAITDISFDGESMCSVCKPSITTIGNFSDSICSWDYSNMYYGNNGSLACLNDPDTSVAFLNIRNINNHLTSLGLQASQFRALCYNNSLAVNPGVAIDDNCLLAYVVDAEVVTRRDDPLYNSLNALFDSIDLHFGYNAASGRQLINFEIFSPFDGTSDLLFKDSTIGLTEPSIDSSHEPARNYIELFRHLQACTGTAAPVAGLATRSIYSFVGLFVMAFMTRFVLY
ncbi:hypothetical protein K1T71_014441 [Dendrolimus kikuchii]|uniref:Uncharacterized protein n=1 Tax=Dendrolimus kikuchii TaxID=765133 RepID=A0ACC1CE03_9NEOP|nr:hypothetical protein K1T71_014441 [Dendrolimus kikuchii]